MKKFKNISKLTVYILVIILLVFSFNLFLGKHPILDFFQFLAIKDYLWLIPLAFAILLVFWQHNINIKKKMSNERIEIFNATIRTVQDILQNSTSSMQLLILDMKESGVHDDIINKAEKNIDELKTVISTLTTVDPSSIEFEELNRKVSIIKMKE